MGICASSAYSSEVHEVEEFEGENVIMFEQNCDDNNNGVDEELGSVFTMEGSKGLNQDSAILYKGFGIGGGTLCGVFDGHGQNGHIVSKIVRNRLPDMLLAQKNALTKIDTVAENTSYEEKTSTPNSDLLTWEEACLSSFKVIDKEINIQENFDFSSSGTTAVVVIRQGEDLVIANLGDSRAVLGTVEDGEIKTVQLTTDLKPSLPCEADRIRRCNGRVLSLKAEPHIQRVWLPHTDSPGLAMSRAFGNFLLKNHGVIAIPDISYYRLATNDQFVVLATDGVWDVLSNDEVVKIVSEVENKQEAARILVEAAKVAWKVKFPSTKVDDCTVVCLFLHNT